MISLSPLPTAHPSFFQQTPVRASTECYLSFTLLKGRSPWLRVCTPVLNSALVTGLAFAAAPLDTSLASHGSSNSPDHNAKGTQSGPMPLAGHPPSYRLWACGFRLSFTPRTGVLFTFPSRYSSTIGHTRVFSLGGWSPQLHARLLVSGVTQELHYVRPGCRLPGSHRLWRPVPGDFRWRHLCRPWVLQPRSHKETGLGSADFARRYSRHLG